MTVLTDSEVKCQHDDLETKHHYIIIYMNKIIIFLSITVISVWYIIFNNDLSMLHAVKAKLA